VCCRSACSPVWEAREQRQERGNVRRGRAESGNQILLAILSMLHSLRSSVFAIDTSSHKSDRPAPVQPRFTAKS
jgi:hypothetical protein